jgi:hypothetical protein
MTTKDKDGTITETPEEATQAERSPDTFIILIVSLAALAVIGVGFAWYFGMLPAKMFG